VGIADSPLRDRLVFLVGARRSGTNWLQRMICAHPDAVAVPSETHLFSHGFAPLVERFQHGAIGSPKTAKVYLPRDDLYDFLRDIADRTFGGIARALAPDARLIVERTPWHAYQLDLIGAVYPDAPVVHILRDGRDVARSLLSQQWGPTRMQDAAEEWRSAVTAARAGGAGLNRFLELRYEELLADPAGAIPPLYRWLGLDDRDDVVRAALIEAGVRFNTDASNPEVAEGKWRTELSALDQRIFDRVAGTTLVEAGYRREDPPGLGRSVATSARTSAAEGARAVTAAARRRRPGRVGPDLLPSLDRPFRPARQSVARMEQLQDLLDRVLTAFNDGDGESLGALLTPGALVQTITGPSADGGRDASAHEQFLAAVAKAAAGRGVPRRGDAHVGEPVATIVAGYETAAGGVELHTLVLGIAGDQLDRLTWYRPTA
jgi:hypothetical protein